MDKIKSKRSRFGSLRKGNTWKKEKKKRKKKKRCVKTGVKENFNSRRNQHQNKKEKGGRINVSMSPWAKVGDTKASEVVDTGAKGESSRKETKKGARTVRGGDSEQPQ